MSKKKDMDAISATRILALWNVSRPADKQESDYVYRVMARWLSEKFNYKLDEVDDLPIEFIAQHYYEAHYEDQTPEEREAEMRRLTASEEEMQKAAAADDEFLKQAIEEAQQASKLTEVTSALKEATQELKKELAQPDIKMEFVSPEEMEAMGEWDILGLSPSSDKK
jgi:hypothetical protein